MNVPGLGQMTEPDDLGWRRSEPLPVVVLRGQTCRIVLEGYDDDQEKGEFHEAIENFLAADATVLEAAASHIFRYYQDCNADWEPGDEEYIAIQAPADVWDHITLGDEPTVTRRGYGDHGVYVTLECNCDWEPEHGLQIVFRRGLSVCKVGPNDGHVTNSDAYANPGLEHVIYKPR